MTLYCSDHQKLAEGVDPFEHLKVGHAPGAYITDRAVINRYFVVLPNGNVKQTGYSQVTAVLAQKLLSGVHVT